jgi:16S rRNA (guanine527-N7)-methyltransferase
MRFLDLLDRWNRTHALTALSREARFEELILDSWVLVSYLDFLPSGSRIVDFGSGMGVPAIVLSLARPDLEVIALDKSKKKMAFVRQAALELGLVQLKPIVARAEDLPALEADLGVAKAVGSLSTLLDWWVRHGKNGGTFLALKGEKWTYESGSCEGWEILQHPYRLPTRGNRVVLELREKKGPKKGP